MREKHKMVYYMTQTVLVRVHISGVQGEGGGAEAPPCGAEALSK